MLITGETGTGKELIARAIHNRSPRAGKPFVAINCGAIPENLLESELFGHVKGAFTGAVANKQGQFEAADGGTLFLDEIGEMPLALQVKLLRVLQERVVFRVGDTRAETVDIRIIAATNRDLEKEIAGGRFREDLYYRLNVVNVELPPLRERGDDMLVIARYLLSRYAREYDAKVKGLSPNAAVAIRKHNWPGNIRELENRIKKAIVLCESTRDRPRRPRPRPATCCRRSSRSPRRRTSSSASTSTRCSRSTTAIAPRPRAISASIRARCSATSRRSPTRRRRRTGVITGTARADSHDADVRSTLPADARRRAVTARHHARSAHVARRAAWLSRDSCWWLLDARCCRLHHPAVAVGREAGRAASTRRPRSCRSQPNNQELPEPRP